MKENLTTDQKIDYIYSSIVSSNRSKRIYFAIKIIILLIGVYVYLLLMQSMMSGGLTKMLSSGNLNGVLKSVTSSGVNNKIIETIPTN